MKIDSPNATGIITGFGIPAGGTSGQVLQKVNATNYNLEWVDAANKAKTLTETLGDGLWVWSMGTPAGFGWTLTGNATYSNAPADGIILTPALNNQSGAAFKVVSTSYFNDNDFIMSINAKASGGTGADGIAMYVGSATNSAGVYDGIVLYMDEYNNGLVPDAVKIYKNGSVIATFDPATYLDGLLDNNRWRKWSMVVTGASTNRTVTVLADDVILWRGSIGAWTPTGANYGMWGFTGGLNNKHAVSMINLHPAKVWMMQNGLI